jgi:hypothetical protein
MKFSFKNSSHCQRPARSFRSFDGCCAVFQTRAFSTPRFPPSFVVYVSSGGALTLAMKDSSVSQSTHLMAPAGAVGGGPYTSSDIGVRLLDVPKYYIVAAASSSLSLTHRRRDASCLLTSFVAVLTAGAIACLKIVQL